MRITHTQLRQLIREQVETVAAEQAARRSIPEYTRGILSQLSDPAAISNLLRKGSVNFTAPGGARVTLQSGQLGRRDLTTLLRGGNLQDMLRQLGDVDVTIVKPITGVDLQGVQGVTLTGNVSDIATDPRVSLTLRGRF